MCKRSVVIFNMSSLCEQAPSFFIFIGKNMTQEGGRRREIGIYSCDNINEWEELFKADKRRKQGETA